MDIHVCVGEWTNSLRCRMDNAVEGDVFCLPTSMHLHAFSLLQEAYFPDRDFKVKLDDAMNAR
jgi:hypothetical protein